MASTTDIRRLVLNDHKLSTLILTFDHTLNIPQLAYALSVNVCVKEVVVYIDETFMPRFPLHEIRSLLEILGAIPSLQRLCFNSRSGFDGVISIQALVFALTRATRLSSFAVSDLKLTGDEYDWSLFAEQLQRVVYMKSFCIIECELVMSRPDLERRSERENALIRREYPLDPLLMVLSILPCMEKIYLHSTRSGGLGKISPQAAGALLLSRSLEVLKMRDFDIGLDTLQSMARMLQINRKVYDLKVGTTTQFDATAAKAIASMLEVNTTLTCLEMGLSKMISDECAQIVAKALKVNKGLKTFAMTEEKAEGATAPSQPVTAACKAAFVDTLRSNYVLENFVLFQRFPVKPEFKLFVTLNKLGRGRLLLNEEIDPEKWVQALEAVNDDIDAIFYYMSINPDLCSLALENMKERDSKTPATAKTAKAKGKGKTRASPRTRKNPSSTTSPTTTRAAARSRKRQRRANGTVI